MTTEEQKQYDMVNHPQHYTQGKYEHVEVVKNWGLGYHLGNSTKYMMRSPHKGKEIEDLEKGYWYLADAVKDPSIAVIQFPLIECMPTVITIGEVADDWFGSDVKNTLRKSFFHIGTAALHCFDPLHLRWSFEEIRSQLISASQLLELVIRNKKAEQNTKGNVITSEELEDSRRIVLEADRIISMKKSK